MMSFSEKLKLVIGNNETAHAWATRMEFPANQVGDWIKNDRTPRRGTLVQIAEKTGIPIEWWLFGEGEPPGQQERHGFAAREERTKYVVRPHQDDEDDDYEEWAGGIDRESFVPVRYFREACVSAGHGAVNSDHTPEALLFSREFLRTINARPRDLYLVKVKGDSMLPTLQAGWTVMIDASKRAVNSGIYVIRLAGQEVCKRLEARPGGVVKVISDNRLYDEYEINAASASAEEFQILGTVVWFAGVLQ